MRVIYEADDGTQFDYRNDCEAYEKEKGSLQSGIIFDSNFKRFDISNAPDGAVKYVYLPTDVCVELFGRNYYSEGIECPGFYVYDNNREYYVDVSDCIFSYQDKIEELNRALKNLTEVLEDEGEV